MDYSLVIDKEVGSIVDNKKTSEEDKGLETTDVKHKGDEKAHDAVPLLEKKDSFEETLICQICQVLQKIERVKWLPLRMHKNQTMCLSWFYG